MKIEFNQSVDVSGEVEVGIEEIRQGILEDLSEVERRMERGEVPDSSKQYAIKTFVHTIYQSLEGLPDEAIELLGSKHRDIVSDFLGRQAARFANRDSSVIEACQSDGSEDQQCSGKPSSDTEGVKFTRTLVRVNRVVRATIAVVVPGWDPRREVYVPVSEVPEWLRDLVMGEKFGGARVYASVNLRADYEHQLAFHDWKLRR